MKTRRILMALLIAAVMTFAMSVSVVFADDDYYKEPNMKNVTGIEFKPADGSLLLEELVDGTYDYEEERDDVFYYGLWRKLFKEGSELILVNKDGSRSKFVYNPSMYSFVGKDGYYIDYDDVDDDSMDRQRKEPWGLGDHTFNVEYKGFKCELTATVVENSIKTVEYIPAKPYDFIENCGGWWRTNNGNRYYCYSYRIYDGDAIRLNMKDGSVKTYVYTYDEDYDDEFLYFRCKEGGTAISSQNISISDDQDQNHWVKGGDYYVTFKYADKEARIPVTIVDSPIDSISYEPASPIVYVENLGGCIENDDNGNEYFEYYEPDPQVGDKLTVVRNGSSKTYTFSREDWSFVCGDESIRYNDIEFYTNQDIKNWTLGSDNEFIVNYLGRECTVPVTVSKNKVKSIAYVPAVQYEYDELDTDRGYWDEDSDGNDYYRYDLPDKADGDKLTVTTDEGNVDYIFDEHKRGYVSESGDLIDFIRVYFSSSQSSNHWEPGKENFLEVEYMGTTCFVPVIIHGSTKKSTNTLEVTAVKKTLKAKALKKKALTFKAVNVKKAQGKVTFTAKTKGKSAKALKFNKKTAKVTIRKGTKKGKYTIKVTVKAAGNRSYKPMTITKTVKVTVK